ncbi:hypothetical protein [Nitrosovibrio tenuis]|uniref:Uncharacterized protein n=1 Tax=Nitrosovibrio tenuis TaxID=1233 RepID=A0A1H7H567_9PROT|nr:hypothetical protein [Nitrosovibrio tenuis]SEK44140.1 hypothetical protein SAMN05216387_101445 [Nitrosovibrio tenuis]
MNFISITVEGDVAGTGLVATVVFRKIPDVYSAVSVDQWILL